MTGQAICFTASEGLAYKCPLEAKSLASPQFIRSGMTTMAGAELARWRVAPHTVSLPPKTGNLPTAQKKERHIDAPFWFVEPYSDIRI